MVLLSLFLDLASLRAKSFDSLPDHTIMYKFAKKFGFADRMFRQIKVTNDEPYVEDVTREFNSGMWTIGYTGQSPERIKAHMANQHVFDSFFLRRLRKIGAISSRQTLVDSLFK